MKTKSYQGFLLLSNKISGNNRKSGYQQKNYDRKSVRNHLDQKYIDLQNKPKICSIFPRR